MQTVCLAGLIRDNGVVSPLNRGTFYGCRDSRGRLTGVALIGHATFVEARTPEALRSLAAVAQGCRSAHMILGESEVIEQFWHHYADGGRTPRLLRPLGDRAPRAMSFSTSACIPSLTCSERSSEYVPAASPAPG